MPIHKKPKAIHIAYIFVIIFLIPFLCLGNEEILNTSDTNTNNWSKSLLDSTKTDSLFKSSSEIEPQNTNEEIVGKSRAYNKINQFALWLMGDKNVSEFKKQMADFGENNFPLILKTPYHLLLEHTYAFPVVFFFILFILMLFINTIFVLWVIYISNQRKNHKEKYIEIYRNSYEEIFRSYLFGEIDWDIAYIKLKRKNRRLNQKILTNVLIVFKENLRGEMDAQLTQMYKNLGLEKDSIQKMKSIFYHRKIEGMKAITNLDPESAKALIPKYLNNSHIQVRTEAQVSYVRLHPEAPFEFLKDLTSPFPRWTQLSAFHIFRLHQVPVPSFIEYIESGVPTIRNFSLRMIIFFQQLENASAIYNLLDSPYEITRFLAIRAVNDLRLVDGKQKIKEKYPTETEKNKIEIIKALRNIGDSDDYDFLESVIKSNVVSLKLEACRSYYYVNPIGKYRLKTLSQNKDLHIEEYLAHVTDPRN